MAGCSYEVCPNVPCAVGFTRGMLCPLPFVPMGIISCVTWHERSPGVRLRDQEQGCEGLVHKDTAKVANRERARRDVGVPVKSGHLRARQESAHLPYGRAKETGFLPPKIAGEPFEPDEEFNRPRHRRGPKIRLAVGAPLTTRKSDGDFRQAA